MNIIRNYNNQVILNFEERGETFSLNVPHYNKWIAIIKFMRNRGFKIGVNEYFKKQYACLSKFNKIGFKKDVVCLMEIGSAYIKIEFGNIKNLWSDIPQSFWSNPTDDRFTKLTYLEDLAVKLEIKKLLTFCKKWDLKLQKEDSDLNPEEYIINSLKNNKHIHGNVECFNDIKMAIKEDSYDYKHNSNDRNNKKIICGDKKYFYDYRTKRLSCGIAWHNINNMWWVIVNDRKYNIASFNLFDFDSDLPRREKISKNRLEEIIKKYESKKDYFRCFKIQKIIERKLEKVV